jgi:hypothetical protein
MGNDSRKNVEEDQAMRGIKIYMLDGIGFEWISYTKS